MSDRFIYDTTHNFFAFCALYSKQGLMQYITDRQQVFINRQFFNLTVFTLIFGVMFYDMIDSLGFSYVDEICAVLLLALFGYKVFQSKTWQFNRAFLFTLTVFIFYLVYSIVIGSNTIGAILTDFVIQLKPYLAFFCVFAINPVLSDNQKKIIRQLIVLCSLYVLTIGVAGLIDYNFIAFTFSHLSRLATASSILALLYLYCSNFSITDRFVFIMILAVGVLSTRSKHFGYFAFCTLFIIYFSRPVTMKFNLKNTVFTVIVLAFTVLVAWEKIYFYFITGGLGSGRSTNELYARMALYYFSIIILKDFIPFGSGFASYATYTSGASYSPIYIKYGMHNMYGLTKSAPNFVADTYYPALAQFGYVGVVLFFYFWFYLAKKAVSAYAKGYRKESLISIMIILFFLIECTSDSTITHNRGMFMMMLSGLILSDIKIKNTNEGTDRQ